MKNLCYKSFLSCVDYGGVSVLEKVSGLGQEPAWFQWVTWVYKKFLVGQYIFGVSLKFAMCLKFSFSLKVDMDPNFSIGKFGIRLTLYMGQNLHAQN